jgi:hypothetical protein
MKKDFRIHAIVALSETAEFVVEKHAQLKAGLDWRHTRPRFTSSKETTAR